MIRPVQKVSSIDDNLKFNWVSDFHQIIKAKFLSQNKEQRSRNKNYFAESI